MWQRMYYNKGDEEKKNNNDEEKMSLLAVRFMNLSRSYAMILQSWQISVHFELAQLQIKMEIFVY